jgi:hypothetical protein
VTGVIAYVACTGTALTCTWLLFRAWRRTGGRLLLWSALCFAGLAVNNLLMFVDVAVLPEADLSALRGLPMCAGLCALVYGLVWEVE